MQYKKNGCFILKNSEEIDGEELRNSLPADLTNQWNRILLSSIDIDELDDEADMEFYKHSKSSLIYSTFKAHAQTFMTTKTN